MTLTPQGSGVAAEHFQGFFHHSSQSIFLVNPEDGKINYANPSASEDSGYELAELDGRLFRDLFFDEDRVAIDTLLSATVQWKKGLDPQRNFRKKSGRKIIGEINTSIGDVGGSPRIICTLRDITARIRAEEKVKQYTKELETLNAELEMRVADRTKDLQKANEDLTATHRVVVDQKQQIDVVMTHIQQAIFTFPAELKVNSEYSRFSEVVFGQKKIADADVVDLLFDPVTQQADAAGFREWLDLAFKMPEAWSNLREVALLKHVYIRQNADGSRENREWNLQWVPVFEGDKIIKFMVVCDDITEQVRLRAEVAKREKENQDRLELIAQMLSLPDGAVDQFVKDTRRMIEDARVLLQNPIPSGASAPSAEFSRRMMGIMHTIKGNARQLKLDLLQRLAAEMEEGVSKGRYSELAEIFSGIEKSMSDINHFYEKIIKKSGSSSSLRGDVGEAVSIEKIEALVGELSGEESSFARTKVEELLKVPVSSLFERLKTLLASLRDEKKIALDIQFSGEQLKIDSRMISPLFDGLSHIVRNIITHGVDLPEDRVKVGKPKAVQVIMSARATSDHLVEIVISDDGRGIDTEKVGQRLVEKGMIDPAALSKLSADRISQFVLMPGFTTKDEVTDLSGRGIGTDVLKDIVEKKLGGEIHIHSKFGYGVKVALQFPDTYFKTEWDQLKEPEIVLNDWEIQDVVQRILSTGKVQHCISSKSPHAERFIKTIKNRTRMSAFWNLEAYLAPATSIHEHTIRAATEKAGVLVAFQKFIEDLMSFSALSPTALLMADEMIMNAIFNAPVNPDGSRRTKHMPRNSPVVLEKDETVKIRYGADSTFLGFSVEDPFGSLSWETVFENLKRGYSDTNKKMETKPQGAGLGIYLVFDSSHYFVLNVVPGKKTEVICLIALSSRFLDFQEMGKSCSFFIENSKGNKGA